MIRKRYTPNQKASLVLELFKEEDTLPQVASRHGVHPNQLRKWYAGSTPKGRREGLAAWLVPLVFHFRLEKGQPHLNQPHFCVLTNGSTLLLSPTSIAKSQKNTSGKMHERCSHHAAAVYPNNRASCSRSSPVEICNPDWRANFVASGVKPSREIIQPSASNRAACLTNCSNSLRPARLPRHLMDTAHRLP
ncbi:MAG: transposase [Chloroflexi bacterium]|nr:transposase [Chloroflexota bacterium]